MAAAILETGLQRTVRHHTSILNELLRPAKLYISGKEIRNEFSAGRIAQCNINSVFCGSADGRRALILEIMPKRLEVVLKKFDKPDEIRTFEKGRFELVKIGGMREEHFR